ncbi:alpha/beta fold hydrolase [Myxococcota bacterium]|nr:alpha/beta fold hydrolase [Myxococcota bacterium]MBU1432826.1 alpha/beta fold hydrolase [Myxococcota bacterium]MBU1897548.1 alpha/beta fold hydrolase [Myxococcota bacterium]
MHLVERASRFMRVLREAPGRSPRNLHKLRAELGICPSHARRVHQESAFELLAFDPAQAKPGVDPVLLIPSLINRWYVLDLLDGHSLIQALNAEGLRVYVLAWRDAHDGMGAIPLARYVSEFMGRAVERACRDAGAAALTLLGQCLGGTLSLAYAARYPRRIARLIALTTPVDFSQESVLGTWSSREVIDVDRIAAAYPGVIPNRITYGAFPLLDPRALISRRRVLFQMIDNAEFVQLYQALELWTTDHLPVACGALIGITRGLYQENQLWRGDWIIEGHRVELEDIRCPVLNARAAHDHIVPAAASEALQHKIKHAQGFISPMGHVTLILASPLRAQTYAALAQFCQTEATP